MADVYDALATADEGERSGLVDLTYAIPLTVGMVIHCEAVRRNPDGTETPLWQDTAVVDRVWEAPADGDERGPE